MPNPGERGYIYTSRAQLADAINQEASIDRSDIAPRLRGATLYVVSSAFPGCIPDNPGAVYATLKTARAAFRELRAECKADGDRMIAELAEVRIGDLIG